MVGTRNVKHRCLVCGVPDEEKPICFQKEWWCCEDHRKVIQEGDSKTKYPFEYEMMLAGVAIRTMHGTVKPISLLCGLNGRQEYQYKMAIVRHGIAADEDKEEMLPMMDPPLALTPQGDVAVIKAGNVEMSAAGYKFISPGGQDFIIPSDGSPPRFIDKEEPGMEGRPSDNGVRKEWIG